MTDRPILFSAPMVRALLSGTKTQTRRVLKQATGPSLSVGMDDDEPGVAALSWLWGDGPGHDVHETIKRVRCPYGQPGDRLYLRETWQAVNGNDRARHIVTHPAPDRGWIEYAATPRIDEPAYKWRPSIHMPRWASRITLDVTGIRVERLQDISEADAIAEGVNVHSDHHGKPRTSDYIFPVQGDSWSSLFPRACDELEIVDLRLYDLRHEAISRLVESRKYSIPEMMLITGHKDPKQLMRYTQLRAKDLHR